MKDEMKAKRAFGGRSSYSRYMLMHGRLAVRLLCCVAIVTSVSAQGDDEFSSEIARLRTDLEEVATGGYWSRNEEEDGRFRLIIRLVGFEHLRNHVYLQWIRGSHDPNEPHVIERTVPIDEISGWRVTDQRFVLEKKQWKIVITAERENVLEDMPKTRRRVFSVVPGADHTYRITDSAVNARSRQR